jgi:DNA replication protein DnaC
MISREKLPALIRIGIPERTVRAAISAVDTEATQNALGAKECIVVLAGHTGVGKSVAACIWLYETAIGREECMRWIQSGDLARGFSYDHESFNTLTNVFALVIDDFGVEYLDEKGRFKTTLEEVLSRRFAKMRRTFITTNIVDPEEFSLRYGDRIASRIHEDGVFIVCGGVDLRRKISINLLCSKELDSKSTVT